MSRSGDASPDSPEIALADLIEEINERLRAGEPVVLESYASRYPQLAPRLEELLPTLRALAELSRGGRGSRAVGAPSEPNRGLEPLPGMLGDFRIFREIGRGGMGVVYEAQQMLLGRRVALKVLPFAGVLDSRELQRFRNEAQAAASLKHPNIVTIFSVGSDRGIHYYAMDYIEGQTLAEVIRQLRTKHSPRRQREEDVAEPEPTRPADRQSIGSEHPEEIATIAETAHDSQGVVWTRVAPRTADFFRTAARWGIQAAEALEHAHQMGVVHRDIKPSNLLIDSVGRLMVTDFGLAQTQAGMQLTMTGDVVGTLRYMSPEQAQGNRRVLDYRTDIYSLGVTLYELLTLRPPFESDDRHTLLHQVLEGSVKPLRQIDPAIPRDLETVVMKAMAAEPQARYTTAQELADDLRRFLEHQPVRVRRPSLVDRAAYWSRRHRPVVWSAAVSLAVIVAALGTSTVLVLRAYRGEAEQRAAAEASSNLATKNYEEARQAVRQMLTRVADEQVGAIPEMKEIRRRLLEDAVAFYTQLLELNAEDPAVYSDRAEAYTLLARYAEARADLKRAVELAPDNAAYQFQLGAFLGACPDVAYRDLGRAVVHTKRAVDLEPRNAAYLGELIVANVRLREPAEAQAAIQQLVAITPPTARGFADRAQACLVAGDPQAALAWAEKAVALEPAAEWTQLPLAESLAALGERQRAMDVVNRVFERSAARADCEMPAHWAHLLVKMGDDERALPLISQAIKINLRPQDVRTFYFYDTRAEIYYRLGRRAEALADLDKSLELGPFRSFAYKRRGRVHFDLKNYDLALRDIAKAVELKPDDLSNVRWISLHEVAACPDESFRQGILRLIDKSVALNPGLAEAITIRGLAYRLFGNLEEEIARLEQVGRESLATAEHQSRLTELRCWQLGQYSAPADARKDNGDHWRALASTPDGKLVAGGICGAGVDMSLIDFTLARYNANGTLDTTFGTKGKVKTSFGATDMLNGVVVLQQNYTAPDGSVVPAGTIYAGGHNGTRGETHTTLLARYTSSGKLDTAFGSGGLAVHKEPPAEALGLAFWDKDPGMSVEPRILQTGYTTSGDLVLVCYTLDGNLDTSFGSGGVVVDSIIKPSSDELPSQEIQLGNAVASDAQGRILVGCSVYKPGETFSNDFAVARYTAAGELDTDFGAGKGCVLTDFGGIDDVRSIAVDPSSGEISVAGMTDEIAELGSRQLAVATYDGWGTPLRQTITPIGASSEGWKVAYLPSDRIIVAGTATLPGGSGSDVAVACYMADTLALDPDFGPVIPSVSICDASASEGDSGATNFNFLVSLSSGRHGGVTLSYATANGTATTANKDYKAISGTLTFVPGEISKWLTVSVIGDTKIESDETFFVNLSNALNATIGDGQGLGTIWNDDPAPASTSSWALAVDQVLAEGGRSGSDKILEPEAVDLLLYR